jgi:hypothetical protein
MLEFRLVHLKIWNEQDVNKWEWKEDLFVFDEHENETVEKKEKIYKSA